MKRRPCVTTKLLVRLHWEEAGNGPLGNHPLSSSLGSQNFHKLELEILSSIDNKHRHNREDAVIETKLGSKNKPSAMTPTSW